MKICSASKTYELLLQSDFSFAEAQLLEENAMFVIDRKVFGLYKEQVFAKIPQEQLYLIDALEKNKTIETALALCGELAKLPAKRNAHIISFGGGIVQDITGFAANILYRGIRWTFVPTTLLAACDSCIGGKTSLNYKSYKNLLGTFFPPDTIHICPGFFATLSENDFKSGLGEVVKFNMMFGEAGLVRMEQEIPLLLAGDTACVGRYMERSLQYKKDYIEADEFDRGIRVLLNFAHTFGHALETVSHYAIPHGTAVAMGMIAANRVSLARGWLTEEKTLRMEAILLQIIPQAVSHTAVDEEAVIAAIRKDKKQTGTDLTAVLMYSDMKLKIVHDLKPAEIRRAVSALFSSLAEP